MSKAILQSMPIDDLIAAPMLAAAETQSRLIEDYIDQLLKLAYVTDTSIKQTDFRVL
jgi:hypothetical protein